MGDVTILREHHRVAARILALEITVQEPASSECRINIAEIAVESPDEVFSLGESGNNKLTVSLHNSAVDLTGLRQQERLNTVNRDGQAQWTALLCLSRSH